MVPRHLGFRHCRWNVFVMFQLVLEADGYQPYLLSPEKGLASLIRSSSELAKDLGKSCVHEVWSSSIFKAFLQTAKFSNYNLGFVDATYNFYPVSNVVGVLQFWYIVSRLTLFLLTQMQHPDWKCTHLWSVRYKSLGCITLFILLHKLFLGSNTSLNPKCLNGQKSFLSHLEELEMNHLKNFKGVRKIYQLKEEIIFRIFDW